MHEFDDACDRTEIRRRHVPLGHLDVEFRFHREHEDDEAERGRSELARKSASSTMGSAMNCLSMMRRTSVTPKFRHVIVGTIQPGSGGAYRLRCFGMDCLALALFATHGV